jgi:hypothetical protein
MWFRNLLYWCKLVQMRSGADTWYYYFCQNLLLIDTNRWRAWCSWIPFTNGVEGVRQNVNAIAVQHKLHTSLLDYRPEHHGLKVVSSRNSWSSAAHRRPPCTLASACRYGVRRPPSRRLRPRCTTCDAGPTQAFPVGTRSASPRALCPTTVLDQG